MKRLLAFVIVSLLALPISQAANWKSVTVSCPSSGTKVVSSSSAKASLVTVQSLFANTGVIYLGDKDVGTTEGMQLLIGDSYTAPPQGNNQAYDLGQMFFACSVNTDSITVLYAQ